MIFLENVEKKFGSKVALHNISFSIKKGEVVGLLGPNGAGKTTTMRIMLGFLQPTDGSVKVDNMNPTKQRIAISRVTGYLPENNPLWGEMLVREYLLFVSKAKNENVVRDELANIIEDCHLSEVLEEKIENLSRGFKQRVGLAAALLGNPEILVLDEPTSGLDPLEQEKIRKLLKKLQKNKTIILSTHILSEVEAVCNRVIIIHRGKVVHDGLLKKTKGGLESLFKKVVKE